MDKTFNPCGECGYRYPKQNQESYMCKICEFRKMLDLEKQGKLLKLPAAIGDEIFFIFMDCPKDYKEEYCRDHEGSCENCHHRIPEIVSRDFRMSDILNRDNIFATRQEAKASLKKRLREHIQNLPKAQELEVRQKKKVINKAYSFDNEHYSCTYDTDKEALDAALREIDSIRNCDPEHMPDTVYIGDCEFFEPSLHGSSWDIIDAVICQSDDEGFGDWNEDYLSDVTKEQGEELEEGLEKVFQAWVDKYSHHADFFRVNSYDIYAYDKEKHELFLEEKGNGDYRNE